MSRRFGNENILTAYDGAIVVPGATLLPEASGMLYAPRKIVLSTPAGTATVNLAHGPSGVGATPFLTVQVPVANTVCVELPGGLECPVGSGIHVTVVGGSVSATLYYVAHDLTPGITKIASRAASYSTSLLSPKATRNPSSSLLGDQS